MQNLNRGILFAHAKGMNCIFSNILLLADFMNKPNYTKRLLIFLVPLGAALVAFFLLLRSLDATAYAGPTHAHTRPGPTDSGPGRRAAY